MCNMSQEDWVCLCGRFGRPGPVGVLYVGSVETSSHPPPTHPPISTIVSAQISQLYFQHATSVVSLSQVLFFFLNHKYE